ncbi:MAG: DbpA RNA binding domain-containing protein [Treponema sp.]|nr:DbpA RNA binding domain-containing protein [Treponema sp.]MCL2138927.1 DbpA RNA binding domain-containing protein [Treponema sp.]
MALNINIDIDRVKRNISLVVDNIGAESDISLLREYLSIYKKEISVFNRSKVGAYLLMLADQGKNIMSLKRKEYRDSMKVKADKNRKRKQNPVGNENQNSTLDKSRYPLADEESVLLFFNVGRSRRVLPREILGIINTKTAIPKKDIGAIRIFDNYSFVQVRNTVADKIISALNGAIFRGKPLSVDYTKTRKGAESNGIEADKSAY